jgi:hypothetical protein
MIDGSTVQTLGHLAQVLQWPRYAYLRDQQDVICAELDHTYDLIDKVRKNHFVERQGLN